MFNKEKDPIYFKELITAYDAYRQIDCPYTFHQFLNLNIKFINHYDNKFLTKTYVGKLLNRYDNFKPLSYFINKYNKSITELETLIKKKHMKTLQEIEGVLLVDRKQLEYYFDTLYTR